LLVKGNNVKILVLNAGSSSIKYKFFNMQDESALVTGLVERIGESLGRIIHTPLGKEKVVIDIKINDHKEGLNKVAELLVDKKHGVITNKREVEAVTHRVVHGGECFNRPTILNDAAIKAIEDNIPLAPLHNPPNLMGIRVAKEIFPHSIQVGVFDTAFHQTMPKESYMYAIPESYYNDLKVRRYGFHGTSHSYVAKECAQMMGKPLETLNIITAHLGNGCSITAIKDGKSIDTSMGLTPLEGLIMGTRCGDIDPAIPAFLVDKSGMTVQEVDGLLNKKSGLKGLCGTNDLRDILARAKEGDGPAKLAVEMYVRRIKKYIGSYMAILGHVDALVFTAGVGENSAEIRQMVCEGMEPLGLSINHESNSAREAKGRIIGRTDAKIKVMVIPTNEELEMARESLALL